MHTVTNRSFAIGVLATAVLVLLGSTGPTQQANAQQNQKPADSDLHATHVPGNVHVIIGDGGNVTVQVGDQGVVVVDTGLTALAPKLLDQIRKLSTKPIRFIVDTNIDADHIGGNELLSQSGHSEIGGNDFAGGRPQPASVIAHLNVLSA